MKNKNLHIAVAVIIMAVFAFHFLHSELDLIASQCDTSHAGHDFCHLVDNTTTLNKHSVSQSLRSFLTDTPFDFILPTLQLPVSPVAHSSIEVYPPDKTGSVPFYILNRILLI